jgi:hypothetical protein
LYAVIKKFKVLSKKLTFVRFQKPIKVKLEDLPLKPRCPVQSDRDSRVKLKILASISSNFSLLYMTFPFPHFSSIRDEIGARLVFVPYQNKEEDVENMP